jgi:TatD DNase family protein
LYYPVIDAHAHLQGESFEKDIEQALLRAKKAGVTAIVNASTTFEDAIECLELARTYDAVFPAVGLAPYSDLSQLKAVMQLVEDSPDAVAVGEIGLDYPYQKKPEQVEPFKAQVALAMELDLPVVVHSRSAGKYCLNVLEELKAEKVVMHAFDGSIKQARRGFALGFYFSVPLTVVKSEQKQQLAKEAPDELLLLETDSPVLNPAGGRNEPANLVQGRDFIAKLRETTPDKINKLTENNAKKIFGLNI